MDTVVSGIRSTGNLHLGNYFGALKNFLRMQDENNCYFFVADYHSLTTHPHPDDIHGNIRQVLAEYLAAGIDPEKATIYVQSDVPQVAELYLLLNMNAYVESLSAQPHSRKRSASFLTTSMPASSPTRCSWQPTSSFTRHIRSPWGRTRSSILR